MKSPRILLADDHDLMRRGLRTLLESHPDWSVCAEVRTGNEAVAKSEELKPDIAILDIAMPELNGVDAARKILKASPKTEILVCFGLCGRYSTPGCVATWGNQILSAISRLQSRPCPTTSRFSRLARRS